jgi:AcrR family transcriptional regulator
VPRISAARREANRVRIVAAARRCFSRDGFHQTSMPAIAAAAGVSVGAPYRYFASKEEIILEIAGDAFRVVFEPVGRLLAGVDEARGALGLADVVVGLVESLGSSRTGDLDGEPVEVDELLRCAVQAWGELLRHDGVREQANLGFDRVLEQLADAVRNSPAADRFAGVDPVHLARLTMALVHGLVLQRTAFGLTDPAGVAADLRLLLGPAPER